MDVASLRHAAVMAVRSSPFLAKTDSSRLESVCYFPRRFATAPKGTEGRSPQTSPAARGGISFFEHKNNKADREVSLFCYTVFLKRSGILSRILSPSIAGLFHMYGGRTTVWISRALRVHTFQSRTGREETL